MKCHKLLLWLCLLYCLYLAHGAQVYMEFNGLKYAYNTDRLSKSSELSPNYELQQSEHWPYNRLNALQSSNSGSQEKRISHSSLWGWTQPQQPLPSPALLAPPKPPQQPQNIDFSTQQMSHTQHTDQAGHVLGKYSYYDAAGYHELSYKAGAGIGFVVMGGNLAKPTAHSEIATVGHALKLA